MGKCNHKWSWDAYRNPKKPKIFRKRYECSRCGKVYYSNSMSWHRHSSEIKSSGKQAGALLMKAQKMEDSLSAAREAMEKAKKSKDWGKMPHEIHVHLDDLFKAIAN